ncbi:MAG: 2OG-Fe(II) oxygenase [Vulcanimicrobiaceae bacterium]
MTDDCIRGLAWDAIGDALASDGYALTGPLLPPDACRDLIAHYDSDERYRKRVVMARHGFGRGEYRYFADPLPPLVASLRERTYPRLVGPANRWASALGLPAYPATLPELRARCAAAGQTQPTPLILKYGAGDYNALHQDLYGETVFPFQLAVLLSEPGRDFDGGEFVLTQQRPRMQSTATVVPLRAGDGLIFSVSLHAARGARGFYRTTFRHGVSRVRSGERYTLGIIFHDAR